MRGNAEYVNIISGQALQVNGKSVFSDPLPVDEGWYRANLRIGLVFVVGTGTTPITDGELHFIKNILMKRANSTTKWLMEKSLMIEITLLLLIIFLSVLMSALLIYLIPTLLQPQ